MTRVGIPILSSNLEGLSWLGNISSQTHKFQKSHKKTKVQKATLNPNWDNEIITLDPVVGDLNFIKKQVLHIDVWDWDKAQLYVKKFLTFLTS